MDANHTSMRVCREQKGDGRYAQSSVETADFIADIERVFRKHNLALLPTYGGEVSFHDSMQVVPLEEEDVTFIRQAFVHFED